MAFATLHLLPVDLVYNPIVRGNSVYKCWRFFAHLLTSFGQELNLILQSDGHKDPADPYLHDDDAPKKCPQARKDASAVHSHQLRANNSHDQACPARSQISKYYTRADK